MQNFIFTLAGHNNWPRLCVSHLSAEPSRQEKHHPGCPLAWHSFPRAADRYPCRHGRLTPSAQQKMTKPISLCTYARCVYCPLCSRDSRRQRPAEVCFTSQPCSNNRRPSSSTNVHCHSSYFHFNQHAGEKTWKFALHKNSLLYVKGYFVIGGVCSMSLLLVVLCEYPQNTQNYV